jgi:hypothetical protein
MPEVLGTFALCCLDVQQDHTVTRIWHPAPLEELLLHPGVLKILWGVVTSPRHPLQLAHWHPHHRSMHWPVQAPTRVPLAIPRPMNGCMGLLVEIQSTGIES